MEKNRLMLIDTNVFIDHLRNFEPAIRFFEQVTTEGSALFSAITETELLTGSSNDDVQKRGRLLQLLYRFEKIPFSNPTAALAGDIIRQHKLSIADAIVAASALVSGAELVTRNVKDFKNVPNLKVYIPY